MLFVIPRQKIFMTDAGTQLATLFVDYSTPASCWTFIGLGIRLALDVGAHRRGSQGIKPTVESELWKRGFWVLICLDRYIARGLGLPCTTQYEESVSHLPNHTPAADLAFKIRGRRFSFDVELPIECDDEYWETEDPARAFKQPAGKPSRIAFFNCNIRLNNLLGFGLKILVRNQAYASPNGYWMFILTRRIVFTQ